ncbi:MAG: prepilin-type N-terminal cleavage/methylation domain-containing protein [Phycisphaerales bacterium]|nr:prepilin-type N-terminal cleavage/methylation domain-containing protein [Phycisphaerales bacterium]
MHGYDFICSALQQRQTAQRPVGFRPAPCRSLRVRAFTLIELLVVISIIVLLIAILLPAILYAQRQGYISATTSNMKSISMALQQYHADMHFYSDSGMVATSSAYGGAIPQGAGYEVLAEGLLGFLPSGNNGDGAGTSTTPYTLETTKGFSMYPNPKVYGPYMDIGQSDIYTVGGTSPPSPPEYYFTDAFPPTGGAPLPILYYSATPDPTTTNGIGNIFSTSNTASPGSAIFNLADDYTSGSTTTGTNGPGSPPATGSTTSTAGTTSFYSLIGNPGTGTGTLGSPGGGEDNTIDAGQNILGRNSYLLVSAGPDGIYFTGDDVVVGGP